METCRIDGCASPIKRPTLGLCYSHYMRQWRTGSPLPKPKAELSPTCSVDGCDKPRRCRNGLCGMHNERWRRFGDVFYVTPRKHQTTFPAGYVALYEPDHPLARKDGYVQRNRKVLLAAIGPGTHLCHWCQRPVRWDAKWRVDKDCLVADHINGIRDDDRSDNLVPSCIACNVSRGSQ